MSTHADAFGLSDSMTTLRRNLARDLREIGQLSRWLRVEAWHRHSDRDLPGGDALAMLGPTARSYEHYDREVNRAEAAYYADRSAGFKTRWPEIYDTDTDPAPPLLVVGSWVDIVRKELGLPGAQWHPTIQRELTFLGSQLDWLCGETMLGEPYFIEVDALAYDLAKLRRRLEAVLHDTPDDHSVPCIRCLGAARGRLKPVWGEAIDGEDDHWLCDSCGAWLTRDEYRRALVAAHRLTAVALSGSELLAEYGVSMSTVRTWAERGLVRKHHRDASGRVTYDVEDVLTQQAKQWDGRLRKAERDEAAAQQASSDSAEPSEAGPTDGSESSTTA